jgi:hypothetical protein
MGSAELHLLADSTQNLAQVFENEGELSLDLYPNHRHKYGIK